MHAQTDTKDTRLETLKVSIKGIPLTLQTHPALFSPRRIDAGTLAMLQCVDLRPEDKVLDLGCGCGVVGLYAAKLLGEDRAVLLDNDPTAVEVARRNAVANDLPGLLVVQSDGFRSLTETGFTRILCNPPYHTDFSVARHFILKGFNRLVIGGEFWFVTKRDKWYRNKLRAVFGGVECRDVDSYFVFRAEKRRDTYAQKG